MATDSPSNEIPVIETAGPQPGHAAVRVPPLVQESTAAVVYRDRRRNASRRGTRRAEEAHHYLFDWHEPRILYLALAIFLLSCVDALFTLNLLNAGATEANIIMAKMLEHSVDKFIAVKIILTATSLLVMVLAARRKFVGAISVEHLLQLFCCAYLLVILYELYLFEFVFDLSVIPAP